MSLFNNAITGAAGQQGYTISRSVRLRSSASAYFNRTPASAGNRKTWTWSAWVKNSSIGASYPALFAAGASGSNNTSLLFYSDKIRFNYQSGGSTVADLQTSAVYRDPAAWYHIVFVLDTTNATANNRMRLYVNGSEVTSFSARTNPSLNADYDISNTSSNTIGQSIGWGYFDGYLTEINFIDGQALTPSSFGSTNAITGVWQPAKYTGTYGTNGFYLNFSDNSNNTATTIGKDYSGNGNNWTPNNISVTSGSTYDSMLDVPTPYADGGNGRGNYCVLNPLNNVITLSDGNLKGTTASASWNPVISTFGVSSGKWYWEYTVTGNNDVFFGISPSTYTATSGQYPGSSSSNGYGYYGANGNKYNLGAGGTAYGASVTTNDVVGVALDMDAGTLTFYKNNTSQGVSASSITGTWMPAMAVYNNNAVINFGQRPFTYNPPSGYVALNTQNLPDSTIKNGASYFNTSIWTGDGTTPKAVVSNLAFQPDFLWLKQRSAVNYHFLQNSIAGATKYLASNAIDAESSGSSGGWIQSFDSNGYTTVTGSSNSNNVNGSGITYVGWAWKAGGSSSSNTNGSITSTVSVGATQGFSVVTYTGTGANATVGHGLGVTPQIVLVKARSLATGWNMYHQYDNASPATGIMSLNATDAFFANIAWNNTAPTSSVFSIGPTGYGVNNSGVTYVAYCWTAVKGFSAFGSYTGNGSADGPFVYTGFQPRYVMIKRTDTTGHWNILDTSRSTYNVANVYLFADASTAESTFTFGDFLSNGFKLRDNSSDWNASSGTYIYMAFASNPFKLSLAR